MPDLKISQLTNNTTPGPNTGIVPIIEEFDAGGGNFTYSQFRTTVKNLVQSAVTASVDTSVDGGNF